MHIKYNPTHTVQQVSGLLRLKCNVKINWTLVWKKTIEKLIKTGPAGHTMKKCSLHYENRLSQYKVHDSRTFKWAYPCKVILQHHGGKIPIFNRGYHESTIKEH